MTVDVTVKVAVVIPASGFSRRFDGGDKLMARFGHGSVLRATVTAASRSRAVEVVVVARPCDPRFAGELAGFDVRVVENGAAHEGMAAAIRTGVAALPADIFGAAILPADMPAMRGEVLDQLICVFEAGGGTHVVVPVVSDDVESGDAGVAIRQANPVIWPRCRFPDMLALTGDAGAKRLLAGLAEDQLTRVVFHDPHPFTDVDTPETLDRLAARAGVATAG